MNYSEILEKEGNKRAFNYKGFDCLILRVLPETMGHLCGYIRIPDHHKLHGRNYDEVEELYDYQIPSHGGLTFSGGLSSEDGYYIGFDCAHSNDILPASNFGNFFEMATYKNMAYVEEVIKRIVDFIEEEAE